MTIPQPSGEPMNSAPTLTGSRETLIARLEAAEVGSRELDAEICILFQYGGENSEGATNVRTDEDWEGDLLFEVGADECCNRIPAVTSSLDAALALAERALPGMPCELFRNSPTEWGFHFADHDTCYAPTPALALCAAILKATGPVS